MTYTFKYNEFTDAEFIQILNATFLVSSSGKPFTVSHLLTYEYLLNLPAMYGGNRIHWTRYNQLNDLRTWIIEGWDRNMLTERVAKHKPLNNRQIGALKRKKSSTLSSTSLLKETLKKLEENR